MNKLISLSMLAVTLAVSAQETYVSPVTGKPFDPNGKATLEQIKARDARVLKKTGGFLLSPAQGPVALAVDAREKPGRHALDEFCRLYKLGTGLEINRLTEARGKTDPLEHARAKVAGTNVLMAIVVIDNDARLPALSVFPEERIGIVNADKLQGGDDPAAPETRVMKEVWRAAGFIAGVGYSPMPNDIMQPYYSLKELDGNIQAYIQPMNMARMQGFCKRFGVQKARKTPYRVAAQQGWAPAPTNDIQKAVWDEVHAIPKKPVKIQYDKARQKPVVK